MHGDLQMLRDDLSQLTRQVARLLSAAGGEAVDEAKTRMRRMRDDIDETVSAAGHRGREAFSDVSENIGEALQGSLREHPVTTVALALGLGLLVGTALRR
jgi:ElaB/YqjD/DUF883 family membrane-anchored ribosome-binding protein